MFTHNRTGEIMYYSESMIQMVEDLQRQASEMEKEVKDMMELEGRAMGLELDKRKSARDLYDELMAHSESMAQEQAMTWAYVPCDMAESDPHCYPAESFDHSYEDHAEVHMEDEACVHVEDNMIESEAPADMPVEEHVEEHVEPAPVEEHMEPAPVMEEAPVEEHVEPAPAEEHVEAPAVQEPGFDASAEAPAEDPNQPAG